MMNIKLVPSLGTQGSTVFLITARAGGDFSTINESQSSISTKGGWNASCQRIIEKIHIFQARQKPNLGWNTASQQISINFQSLQARH
jgi:hypothetical protein